MNKQGLLGKLFIQDMEPSDPADAVGSLDTTVDTIHLLGLEDEQLPKIVLDSGTYEIDTSGDTPELVLVDNSEGDDARS